MLPRTTEQLHPQAEGLDTQPLTTIARALADSQRQAADSPLAALTEISNGARAMARSLGGTGNLYYVAAGSSGLMAAADAMELGGTFGIDESRIHILMAGGLPQSARMPGATEDDTEGLTEGLALLTPDDTVIVVSASGTTPFTLEAARIARKAGAAVIGIANNPGCPLLELSDHPILLATAPELVSGSTRMGAGTAQKIALNMLSTLMAVELGHVHDGMMVNFRAENAKLRTRAEAVTMRITGATQAQARTALEMSRGAVKPAILLCAGATDMAQATEMLSASSDRLRPALEQLKKPTA